jgi:hypothetical protein
MFEYAFDIFWLIDCEIINIEEETDCNALESEADAYSDALATDCKLLEIPFNPAFNEDDTNKILLFNEAVAEFKSVLVAVNN